MTKVLFTEAARSDIADAVAWYEAHAPEVTPLFLDAVRAVAERIAQNPRQFPPSSHETRRALLRRFPYLVIFRETPDAAIVVAVFHTRRDPREWRARTA